MKTKRLLLLAWLYLTSATVAAVEADFMQGLGDVRYHKSHAQQLDRDFHIYVMLPDDYETSTSNYPTIYLLDGGNLFPMLVPYYRYLNFGEEIPDAIVVGISYGSDSFETGNMRSTDYTAPSSEREYWGGAAAFQTYLADTLLPLIEQSYRSDEERRVIFGQSIGGQFAIYTAMTDPNLFWGHIASNAAMHRNLDYFLEQKAERNEASTSSRLFLAAGEFDDPEYANPRNEWIAHWQSIEYKPWALKVSTLDGHSHMSAPPAAFRQGLTWLFAE